LFFHYIRCQLKKQYSEMRKIVFSLVKNGIYGQIFLPFGKNQEFSRKNGSPSCFSAPEPAGAAGNRRGFRRLQSGGPELF